MPAILHLPNATIVQQQPQQPQAPKQLPAPKAPVTSKPGNRSFILPG